MTYLLTILTSDYLAGAASSLALLGFTWTFIKLLRNRGSRVVFAISELRIVNRLQAGGYNVRVYSFDMEGDSLHVSRIFFGNRTNEILTPTDFVEPLTISVSVSSVIFRAEVEGLSKGSDVILVQSEGKIEVIPRFLMPSHGVWITVHHSGPLHGHIRGITKKYGRIQQVLIDAFPVRPAIAVPVGLFTILVSLSFFLITPINSNDMFRAYFSIAFLFFVPAGTISMSILINSLYVRFSQRSMIEKAYSQATHIGPDGMRRAAIVYPPGSNPSDAANALMNQ